MKHHAKKFYWSVTGLMAAFMLMASVPDLLEVPDAVGIFMHLGYPTYLLLFLGTAKILGVVAVLAPGVPRLSEWAYAGLVFDLLGALYSHLWVGDPPGTWMFPVTGLILVVGSYWLFRRQLREVSGTSAPTAAFGRAARPRAMLIADVASDPAELRARGPYVS